MNTTSRITELAGLAGILLTASSVQAAIVLSTDFNNSGVTAGAMTGVVWTENGITAPTTLSATASIRTGLSGTGDADGGFFSPNAQVNSTTSASPAWSTTWSITVGSNTIDLTSIQLFSAESNSSATIGAGNGGSDIKLTISGTGINLTQSRDDETNVQMLTYLTPVTLSANTSYDVTFTVWEYSTSSQGHFESVDKVIFNGTVVPEPSAALLGGLGALMLLRRRRI